MERSCNARAGSAWDTWHKAGFEFAKNGGDCNGVNLDVAAGAYAAPRDLPIPTIERAFKQGARQYNSQVTG